MTTVIQVDPRATRALRAYGVEVPSSFGERYLRDRLDAVGIIGEDQQLVVETAFRVEMWAARRDCTINHAFHTFARGDVEHLGDLAEYLFTIYPHDAACPWCAAEVED